MGSQCNLRNSDVTCAYHNAPIIPVAFWVSCRFYVYCVAVIRMGGDWGMSDCKQGLLFQVWVNLAHQMELYKDFLGHSWDLSRSYEARRIPNLHTCSEWRSKLPLRKEETPAMLCLPLPTPWVGPEGFLCHATKNHWQIKEFQNSSCHTLTTSYQQLQVFPKKERLEMG